MYFHLTLVLVTVDAGVLTMARSFLAGAVDSYIRNDLLQKLADMDATNYGTVVGFLMTLEEVAGIQYLIHFPF